MQILHMAAFILLKVGVKRRHSFQFAHSGCKRRSQVKCLSSQRTILKFHLLQISSGKRSTLIRGVWDSRALAAALWDKIRNSEEVFFNANNPLGFPTAVQHKTWRCCAVCHGKPALPTHALLEVIKHPLRPPLKKKKKNQNG